MLRFYPACGKTDYRNSDDDDDDDDADDDNDKDVMTTTTTKEKGEAVGYFRSLCDSGVATGGGVGG